MRVIKKMLNNFLKDKSCLFFGALNCVHTERCLEELKNYEMDITIVYSKKRGENLPLKATSWKGDFIFSYRNYWLLPEYLINNAKFLSLNFHPATPRFPGSGPYCWALYEDAKFFGITIHLMNKKFDNGKIIDVFKFPIDTSFTIETLIEKTKEFSVEVFKKFLKTLSKKSYNEIKKISDKSSNFRWTRDARTISDINKMKRIDLNMSTEECFRRIKAFHFDEYPVYVEHKGMKFYYQKV